MEIGQKWKGWTIEECLGKGSFGTVYRITREEFGYSYESALKVIRIPHDDVEVATIRNEGMSEDSVTSYFYDMVQDIASEFALMSQMRGNSNIVSYEDHAVVKLEDRFGWEIYLRMELLTPLFDYLKDNVMSERDVAQLGIDICKALEICEQNNIIHRDIKPDNIFHSKQGTYKLGDFGIARKLEKATVGMSRKGTYSYMAPEVYKDQPYNHTVDIYSLGIVLYRFMNNNRGPFQPPYPEPISYAENEMANTMRLTGDRIPAPCNACKQFSDIILRACSYKPEDRYQSAHDMRTDLESLQYEDDGEKAVFPVQCVDKQEGHPNSVIDGEKSSGETLTMFCEPEETGGSETADNDIPQRGTPDETAAAPEKKEELTIGNDAVQVRNNRKPLFILIAVTVLAACVIGFVYSYFNHPVPYVIGSDADKARNEIENAGLTYNEGEPQFSDEVEKGKVISQTHENKKLKKGSIVEVIISRGKAVEVPDLEGKTTEEAAQKASELGLSIKLGRKAYSGSVPKGSVIKQDKEEGSDCESGDVITVIVSKGRKQVTVPAVSGKSQKEAEKVLKIAGFKVSANTIASSVTAGYVISQSPAAGVKADEGTTVAIQVSTGRSAVRSRAPSTVRRKSAQKKKANKTKKYSKKGKRIKVPS